MFDLYKKYLLNSEEQYSLTELVYIIYSKRISTKEYIKICVFSLIIKGIIKIINKKIEERFGNENCWFVTICKPIEYQYNTYELSILNLISREKDNQIVFIYFISQLVHFANPLFRDFEKQFRFENFVKNSLEKKGILYKTKIMNIFNTFKFTEKGKLLRNNLKRIGYNHNTDFFMFITEYNRFLNKNKSEVSIEKILEIFDVNFDEILEKQKLSAN